MIHLEGMGVVGSLIARRLELEGVPFTWNDTNAQISAWRGSAGGILPLGDDQSWTAYQLWREWLAADPWLRRLTTSARFVYLSKHPPGHGSDKGVKGRHEYDNGLTASNKLSFHVDVAGLVLGAQGRYQYCRQEESSGAPRLITHGFATATRYRWGWTALLRGTPLVPLKRPALYLREGRLLRYVFPTSDLRTWIAGTGSVVQQQPKSLSVEDKVQRWCEAVAPWFETRRIVGTNEGWRPERPGEEHMVLVRNGTLAIKPQGGSGVRLAPLVWQAVWSAVREQL